MAPVQGDLLMDFSAAKEHTAAVVRDYISQPRLGKVDSYLAAVLQRRLCLSSKIYCSSSVLGLLGML